MTVTSYIPESPSLALGPIEKYVPVVYDAPHTLGVARGLLVGTAGTATITEPDGTVRTDVPLQQGYNPIMTKEIASGGTADDIWLLY